ncbi:MAG: hypothetical protein GY913_02535 [Proteobacteria bacterium]|nr:hypothetical protein [Pseudomonadota bacterium]MCP4915778.1 hypothetical protein [Pseudomonadota bacterium]
MAQAGDEHRRVLAAEAPSHNPGPPTIVVGPAPDQPDVSTASAVFLDVDHRETAAALKVLEAAPDAKVAVLLVDKDEDLPHGFPVRLVDADGALRVALLSGKCWTDNKALSCYDVPKGPISLAIPESTPWPQVIQAIAALDRDDVKPVLIPSPE